MVPSKEGAELNKLTDEELIFSFQDGNEKAYTEIVTRYKDKLTNFVYRYVGSYDDSDDIVQDTFVKVYVSKHLYKEVAKFSTWIYTIAINLAKTKISKKQKYKTFSISDAYEDEDKDFDIPDDSYTPDVDANSKFLSVHIQKALDQISESYRELVILRDIEDYSYEEIAEMTGLPMGTVKSRINRGREKLQELLKDIYKEE
ncbi:MAG: sigma-70 family RNA polymerase sigma factor [Chlorobi bacterium]|nr:sigma-70 family RNA polymerase sigma factor [Chlorobiota bacterium]MCI0717083.1 sigma-70 family RNA polymerase sigma factor [Chlorobiota bacterium]